VRNVEDVIVEDVIDRAVARHYSRTTERIETMHSMKVLYWGVAIAAAACAVDTNGTESTANTSAAVSLNAVTRESFDNQGRQGNGASMTPSISPNQRFVVFQSTATTWTNGVNTNGLSQIYLKDRQVGSITLISQAGGVGGNGDSFTPSVSDDGSVAFLTNATNLGSTAPVAKVLVRKSSGVIIEADVTPTGGAPNGGANNPQIAGNGSAVIFQSNASNLVANDTNGTTDVFVASLGTTPPTVTRISNTEAGTQTNGPSFEPTIDYVGRFTAFASNASNIAFNQPAGILQVWSVDLQTNAVRPVSFTTTGQGGAFGDGNSDLPQISGDGNTVSFRSFATVFGGANPHGTLGDIFAVSQLGIAHQPVRVSISSSGDPNNGPCFQSAISFSGTAVAFASSSTNLASNATDGRTHVFVRDRTAGNTIVADKATNGLAGNGGTVVISTLKFSGSPSVPSFSFLVFDSNASNLVFGDTNGVTDVFSASLSP
jgi:hypothetical protein